MDTFATFALDKLRIFRSTMSKTEINPNACNMNEFATLETPSGFPMPRIPKRTEAQRSTDDCQENDVDICVRKIILQKDWTSKIYDEETLNQWSTSKDFKYYEKRCISYAVEECRWRKEYWDNHVGTPALLCKTGLVLAKDDVPQELRSSIMEGLRALQNDQRESKITMSLHPKYKKIHQLVHPNLYAYEKGVTHVLPGVVANAACAPCWDTFLGIQGIANEDKPVRPDTEGLRNDDLYGNTYRRYEVEPPTLAESSNFQWLPSEFFVSTSSASETKPKCHINSYINNLHPIKYKGLYDKIGELFVESLPLLEEVLSEVNDNGTVRKQLARFRSKVRKKSNWRPYMRTPPPKEVKVVEPPIPKFSPPRYSAAQKTVSLHGRPLQVIVKLISMELQPDDSSDPDFKSMSLDEHLEYNKRERPDYQEKGHWHVEGTHDERIVATACCYLDSHNVTEDGLHFRDGSIGSGGTDLGVCETFPGRILAWPNYFHHKTGRVRLEDKTKAGHRALCCFHLVDPTLRIRSTATVPPQQQSWVTEMIDKTMSLTTHRLCDVVQDSALVFRDASTINYEDALDRCKRLFKERAGDANVIAKNFWIPLD